MSMNWDTQRETILLTDAELDAVVGGSIDIYEGEVACPIGHLTVVVAKSDGAQIGVGVHFHL
jgi:hypothetical protein